MNVCSLEGLALVVFLCVSADLHGQRVENTGILTRIPAGHYFRFSLENDFVFLTDYYYTSALNLQLVRPSLKRNPFKKILPRVSGGQEWYGIALDHFGFTPRHIIYDSVQHGDRPYAGCLAATAFCSAIDQRKRRSVSMSVTIGVIGPPALWKPTQTGLHKMLVPAPQPKGWNNQIATDLILDYRVGVEEKLVSSTWFLVNGCVDARVGTFNDKLSMGPGILLGKFIDPFRNEIQKSPKKREAYVFSRCTVSLVGFDASMQGGLLNRNSPYTLSSSQVKRFTVQTQLGIMAKIRKAYLQIACNYLSKEFTGGLPHRWATAGAAFELK